MIDEVCYIVERFPSRLLDAVETIDDDTVRRDVEQCLAEALLAIRKISEPVPHETSPHMSLSPSAVAERILGILTSRRFASCSRSRSAACRDEAFVRILGFVRRDQPIKFYLDIGGGYGAALTRDDLGGAGSPAGLSFVPNCLHVLCLAQVARFAHEVRQIYASGIHMSLVIDNLVAWYVNDIPLEMTRAFCRSLESLIDRLGLDWLVDLLVESEVSDFRREDVRWVVDRRNVELTASQYENVARFCGRRLSWAEAVYRQRLYEKALPLSEARLERAIDGVHLTQRIGEQTLSFRSFPGGDSRIQAGRACFVRNPLGKIVPRLLTSTNADHYRIFFVPSQFAWIWAIEPEAAVSIQKGSRERAAGSMFSPTACRRLSLNTTH